VKILSPVSLGPAEFRNGDFMNTNRYCWSLQPDALYSYIYSASVRGCTTSSFSFIF